MIPIYLHVHTSKQSSFIMDDGIKKYHIILYTGWTFFTYICRKNYTNVCLKRPKINNKRGRGWPIFVKKRLASISKTVYYFSKCPLLSPRVVRVDPSRWASLNRRAAASHRQGRTWAISRCQWTEAFPLLVAAIGTAAAFVNGRVYKADIVCVVERALNEVLLGREVDGAAFLAAVLWSGDPQLKEIWSLLLPRDQGHLWNESENFS